MYVEAFRLQSSVDGRDAVTRVDGFTDGAVRCALARSGIEVCGSEDDVEVLFEHGYMGFMLHYSIDKEIKVAIVPRGIIGCTDTHVVV